MRIAVTGASGFVGGAVATALAADGHDVVGFGRRPDGWTRGEYRVWDLADPAPAVGAEAVVHCAALADDWAPRDEALRVNVGGTRAVLRAFPAARIVHLSTSSVYDAWTPSVDVPESAAPVRRHLSSYSWSKTLAERELAGRDAVVLRPHGVYGPGDTTLLPRVVAAVRGGRLVLPAGGAVRHSLTRIGNLVQAVRLALDGRAGTYNIADAEPVRLDELLADFLVRRGIPTRIVPIPYRAAVVAARASEAAARLTGRRPRLTRYAVSQLGLERTLDISAARDRLGYRPEPPSLDGAEGW